MAMTAPNMLTTIRSGISLDSESEHTAFGTRQSVLVRVCRFPVVQAAAAAVGLYGFFCLLLLPLACGSFCLLQLLFLAAAAASPPTCCCCVGWLRLRLALVRW